MIWRIIIAGLAAVPLAALAQSYDDPRVADYTAQVAAIDKMHQEQLAKRAQLCAAGMRDYCAPMQFPQHLSTEQFREVLRQSKQ